MKLLHIKTVYNMKAHSTKKLENLNIETQQSETRVHTYYASLSTDAAGIFIELT